MGLPQCNAKKPCPLHDHFLQVREDLRAMLESTDMHMLAHGLEDGTTYLKR